MQGVRVTKERSRRWASGARGLAWACALALSGCGVALPGPDTTLAFPESDARDGLGDFALNLRITKAVEEHALRKPELSRSVDVQVRAMIDYVRSHGRGQLAYAAGAVMKAPRKTDHDHYARLYTAALHAVAYLDLERGPGELSRAALAALRQSLGDDARIVDGSAGAQDGGGELAMAQRDGVAFLGLRRLDQAMSDRIGTVLSQWAANETPPRAIVLDFSRCDDAEPDAAAMIVNTFAPGRPSFVLETRDDETGALEHHAFQGQAGWGAPIYASMPVFVVVSERTASLAEAVAFALRHHRMAGVIGTPTRGAGHLEGWFELPDHGRFYFTVADVIGADGAPLHERSVIPDACRGADGMQAIEPRTLEQAKARCSGAAPTQDEAFDYVRGVLTAERAGESGARPFSPLSLQHGEPEA